MARQIYFFMNKEDQRQFVEFIYSQGDVFIKSRLDDRGNYKSVNPDEELKDFIYFIFSSPLKMVASYRGSISEYKAEVIRFDPCEFKDGDRITDGCLSAIMTDYDEKGEKYCKRKEFEDKYKRYKKYIIKNFKISNNKRYYIGPGAYELYKQGWIMGGTKHPVEFD